MMELEKEPVQPYFQFLENLKAIINANGGGKEGGREAYAKVGTPSVTIHYLGAAKPTFCCFI